MFCAVFASAREKGGLEALQRRRPLERPVRLERRCPLLTRTKGFGKAVGPDFISTAF